MGEKERKKQEKREAKGPAKERKVEIVERRE